MSKVVIKLNDKREKFNNIPKEMQKEVSKKISSEWKKGGSKDITRGLSREQELIIMPDMIGVQPNDPNWNFRIRDFWSEFSVAPTEKGITLDISTHKVLSGKKDGEGKDVMMDFPDNIDDYMSYQICLQSSLVAKTSDDMENLEHFDFIMIDKSEEEAKKVSEYEISAQADISYARLISKYKESESTIDWILELLRDKKDPQIFNLEENEKKMLLRDKKEKMPKEFVSIVKDPELENKCLIAQLLSFGVINREGNDYYYLDDKIGSEVALINYLKDATKSTFVGKMKSQLESKVNLSKNR